MQASDLSRDKPFAYHDLNLSSITKRAKFRELFMEHFEKSRKETKDWKPSIVSAMDQEAKKINKFKDVAEFIDLAM